MSLSKNYLQSISMDELLQIAEKSNVFVPKGLCRNLIIEELLELDDEQDESSINEIDIQYEELKVEEPLLNEKNRGLVTSYNTTEVHVLLRDPMWGFVFWDFYQPEYKSTIEDPNFDCFILRVLVFSENNRYEPYDFFDIELDNKDRSRYFYFSFDDVLTRVNLCARSVDNKVTLLAQSEFIHLKRQNIPKNLCVPDNAANVPLFLSGLSIVKKNHFHNYRQVFRN